MKRAILLSIMLVAFLGVVLGLAKENSPASEGPDFETEFVVVRAYFDDPTILNTVTARNEPWEIDREAGYIVLSAAPLEYEWLESLGFRLEVDEKLTALYSTPNERSPGQTEGISGYSCYRTVEETFAGVEAMVLEHPNLAAWTDVGDSWEKATSSGLPGYDIMVLRLTNGSIAGPKPKLLISTGVHAREYTPPELSMRFAEYLIGNYDVDADVTWLLDFHEIHLLLFNNPDGRKHAETGVSWRKNTNENYCSSDPSRRGADLNRNFEFQWGNWGGSSGSECDSTYRGPAPGSEPETQALQNYGRSIFPDQRDDPLTAAAPITATGVYLDIHSYGNLVLWPWGFTEDVAPNGTALQTLGRKFAYFNGYDPSQSISLYPADGTTEEFGYGELGLATYTIEMGSSFFQSCGYFEDTIVPGNLPVMLYAAKVVRTPYLTPAGPDALDVGLSKNPVSVGATVILTATINDTRHDSSNGTEPVQNIAAAEYYIDVPPWITTTTPVSLPLSAVDGAFDSPIEIAAGAIETTGLETGRHIIFVRGKDDDGSWGPFSSTFLFVIDPALAPVIEGYVTASDSSLPMAATVGVGPIFSTQTDPLTGYYQLHVISGTYDITATPESPDYGHSSVLGVTASDTQTIQRDFSLYPVCAIFEDDIESGNQGWTLEDQWVITDEDSHSPIHSWTDSPGTNYPNWQDASLISQSFDLSEYSGVRMDYGQICSTESGYDYCQVEVSTEGGNSWQVATTFDGFSSQWEDIHLDLPEADGQAELMIRFRLLTDGSVTAAGWHIDDINLMGAGPNCVPETSPAAGFVSSSPDFLGNATSFTNSSAGGNLIYEWDFGDGSQASVEMNPLHQFAAAGIYTVTLTATNSIGTDIAAGTVKIVESQSSFLPLVQSNSALSQHLGTGFEEHLERK